MKTTLDHWSEVLTALLPNRARGVSAYALHFAVIDGIAYCIHQPKLEEKDPLFFRELTAYAKLNGCLLKADQRRQESSNTKCRRSKILTIVFLSLCTQGLTEVMASEVVSISLSMIDASPTVNTTLQDNGILKYTAHIDSTLRDQTTIFRIKNILLDHYVSQSQDPLSIIRDLEEMAEYFSLYPEAISLLDSIKNASWELKYSAHTFQTVVKGTRFSVESAIVYFDPRSAAKLRFHNACSVKTPFCVASPADALLHEFLHVDSAFNHTQTFIAQGGMGGQLYPIIHEQEIIRNENTLYRAMTRRDKNPRPIRNEHTGRDVLVSCVTCIK